MLARMLVRRAANLLGCFVLENLSAARGALKSLVERGLVASGATRFGRARLGGRVLVLAYHNIVPRGEQPVGDRSLHLPQQQLADQLDQLCETHEVVPLDAVLDAPGSGRPRVVLTFDDAYRGALTAGLQEVVARRLPATLFAAPGILGDQQMWWDEFADPATGALDGRFRDHALGACRGLGDEVRSSAAREGVKGRALPAWARTAGLDELTRVATGGITVGSHSWSHINCATLGPADMAPELERPLAWLRERFGAATRPWIAWPYGHSSASSEAAVLMAGYSGAFLVEGGFVGADSLNRPARLPRFNVPAGLSREGFALRTSGLVPS